MLRLMRLETTMTGIRVTRRDESASLTFSRGTDAWSTWKTDGVAA